MNEEKIARINELYRKAKTVGLSDEEKVEQADLRAEYIAAIRKNMRGTLNQVSIMNPDGTVTELKHKDKSRHE